jgi:Ca-activated chloride channel family protein
MRYDSARQGLASPVESPEPPPAGQGESYALVRDNPFLGALANPLSSFSVDDDTASYRNVRRFVTGGDRPPADAVRIEELINYFSFEDAEPRGAEPVALTTEARPAPWNPDHLLLRIGVKARSIDTSELPPCNLVFLVDVSGSMQPSNKLPLLQQAFALLVNELRPSDRVALVAYAGAAGLVLPSTPGDRKDLILDAIQRLEAGGSTAGGEGLRLAYAEAQRNRIEGGVNRVILATDGDFNVGESSDAAMIRLIEEKRETGTFLTVLGFGEGNLQDSKMEGIADAGNGHYAYVDSLLEARKVLVQQLGGTLATVAKDVKIQVEFNPAHVAAYRLIGYENRMLRTEDFTDDRKDAGDMGAGHSVTALYELIPAGSADAAAAGITAPVPLRYGPGVDATRPATEHGDELLLVKLRWKEPDGATSRLLERPVAAAKQGASPSCEFEFAASVAEFGMILRASEHRGEASLERVLASARRCAGKDPHGDRAGFAELVAAYGDLTPAPEEERTAEAH